VTETEQAPTITVIGVGNPYRHDDGAGLAVITALHAAFGDHPRLRLLDLDGEPVRLVQAWTGSELVILVDAVRSDQPAGTLHEATEADLADLPSPGVALGGGHLLGISEAVELARAIDQLPPRLRVVGIEGADFDHGEGLSDAVVVACAELAARLVVDIDAELAV
jgi:hydrogenase maturation protease